MRHHNAIERFFVSRVHGDEVLCRELIGDAYAAILGCYGNLRENASAGEERAWVMWVCRSVWSKHWRLAANRQSPLPLEEHMAVSMPDDGEGDPAPESVERLASLLPKREQMYFRLMVGGYSDDDIAVYLGVDRKTVITTRHRILKRLRAMADRGEIRLESGELKIESRKLN